jgi:uncharacterized protein (UPF0333 family)
MRKMFIALLAVVVLFSFNPMESDAKRGGFKSPKGSYKQTPTTPAKAQDNVAKTDPAKTGTVRHRTNLVSQLQGAQSG